MMFPPVPFILTIAVIFSYTIIASPLQGLKYDTEGIDSWQSTSKYSFSHYNTLIEKDQVDCNNPHSQKDPSCWQALDLENWIRNWKNKMPKCTDSNTSNCCTTIEPWSTCFLRMAEPFSGASCYNIDSCVYEGSALSSDLPASELVKYDYVRYNIYGISP